MIGWAIAHYQSLLGVQWLGVVEKSATERFHISPK